MPRSAAVIRYALWIEYRGEDFAGWQFQENAPTVQAALEAAVVRRFGERRRVGGASRTDAGVHALGQVAVLDLAYRLHPDRLPAALNSALPRGVRVRRARPMPAGWDPRRDAREKTYLYLIHNRPVPSPFWERRAWQIHNPLDVAAMGRAADRLVGRHDFSSFRAAGCMALHPLRTLKVLTVVRRGDLVRVRATADAFLYHMVRNLVGTLVDIGLGKRRAADAGRILAARRRTAAGPTAPAHGLYLHSVRLGRSRGLAASGPREEEPAA